MRYLLYARKSSETEDRQVQSIDDQMRALRQLAKQRGLAIVDELLESKSAKAPGQRPVFTQLVARLQQGEADAILCWSLNRLSRNPVDSGTLSWMLQQGQLSCIQTMDRTYLPEDNVLLMAVESGVANQFILDLRKAVVRGMQSKREKGIYPHRAPEGYLNDRAEKTIVPDPERFALVRRAWEMLLTGAYTVPQVREKLEEWGFRTKKSRKVGGKIISRTALYDLFANPFYAGFFVHEGKRYQGSHLPMVSVDEWERAQAIIGKPHHIQPKTLRWAYTGLIQCGVCGCLITAKRKIKHYAGTGRTAVYRYYHCTGMKGCSKTSVPESYIEQEVERLLSLCRINKDALPWLLSVIERHFQESASTDLAAQQAGQIALLAAQKRFDGLVGMRADGELTREEFIVRKEQLETEIKELKKGLRRIETKRDRDRQMAESAARFAASSFERFTQGDVQAKREVATALGVSYLLTLGKLEIAPHPLLDQIRTFSPRENGSDKEKVIDMMPGDPAWCALVDNMRTSLDEAGAVLPFFGYDSSD